MKIGLKKHIGLIAVCITYVVLFLPFLGEVHLFDWDEINFAEAAREMLVTGDWVNVQINYEPFWEKPPLFIWCQALSMQVFGVNALGARFPNVVIGLFTLILIYFPVYRRYGKTAAIFSILLYIGSYTPHFYFKSGIIDPLFNLWMYLSVLYLVIGTERGKGSSFLWSGIFLGLSIITKGPAALLLVGLTGLVFQLVHKVNFYTLPQLVLLVLGILFFPALYFGVQINASGWWFLSEFITYQIELFSEPIASHGQPFYYHIVVLLIGCFPLFILAIRPLVKNMPPAGDATFQRFMKVFFWVVLVIFSLVTTKIVHYSSMCYIPLAIVTGVYLSGGFYVPKWVKYVLGVLGGIWALFFLLVGSFALPYGQDLLQFVSENSSDAFVKMQLKTEVKWSIVPVVLGVVFLSSLVAFLRSTKKSTLVSFLTTNALVITLFTVSFVPPLENLVQGKWIDQLATYQGKEMAHFTRGFKSYAHRFYTHQSDFESLREVKRKVMRQDNVKSSYLKMNQEDKKNYDNAVRDYVIDSTSLSFSLSAKVSKFKEVEQRYPNAKRVFTGNGYAVWERR